MKKIKSITITGAAFKVMTFYGPRFGFPVTLTTEDGSTYRHVITARKKKELPEAVRSEEEAIRAGADAGEFQGVHCQWITGPRFDGSFGMVPVPLEPSEVLA